MYTMSAHSNNKTIWQVEITFNDSKPPYLYMMTNFSNTKEKVLEQMMRQVKWFKPETIKSVQVVKYKLEAVDTIDCTDSLPKLVVQPIEGD
jgi:hypothetical protein